VDDFEIVIDIDLVGGDDAIFAVDREDGHRDHQVAGKLEGVRLCEAEIVRHMRLHSGAGQFPLDGSPEGPGTGAITAKAKSERPQLASGPLAG